MLKASALSAFFLTQAGMPGYWDWPGPWHLGGGGGFWWVFPLLMMVFMIAACAFFMSRMLGGPSHGGDTTSSALKLLNERFAKGEISTEEFEQKRSLLEGASTAR